MFKYLVNVLLFCFFHPFQSGWGLGICAPTSSCHFWNLRYMVLALSSILG